MTEEQKKVYDSLDIEGIQTKLSELMLEIGRRSGDKDADTTLFHHVKEKFTTDEMAYVVCVHVGLKLKDILEKDPKVKAMIQMMRHFDSLDKVMNK